MRHARTLTLLKALALATCASALIGCGQPFRGPWYADAPQPPADAERATVFIVRHTTSGYGFPPNRYQVDGEKIATLTDREYTFVQLEPGRHRFEERGYRTHHELDLDADAGQTYVLAFRLLGRRGRLLGSSDRSNIVRSRFELVTEDENAQRYLGSSSYVATAPSPAQHE